MSGRGINTLLAAISGRGEKFALTDDEVKHHGYNGTATSTSLMSDLAMYGYVCSAVSNNGGYVFIVLKGAVAKSYTQIMADLESARVCKIESGIKQLDAGQIKIICERLTHRIRLTMNTLPRPTHFLVDAINTRARYDMSAFERAGWTVTEYTSLDLDGEEFVRGYYFSK